jgi:hypothetical protein
MAGFWASILAGTLFGFLGSVLANLVHNPLLALIDRWRLSSLKKRFARDAEFHRFVCDLYSGKVDKYIFLMRLCATIIMSFVGSLAAGGTGILLSYISDRPDVIVLRYLAGVSAGGLLSFYVLASARFYAVTWSLSRFEKFDAEFKAKWAAQLNGSGPQTLE